MRLYLFFIVVVFLLTTCKHLPTEEPKIQSNGGAIPRPPVCFNTQILPLIRSNCATDMGCHSADKPQKDLVLLNYASIRKIAAKGDLLEVILETKLQKRMPYLRAPLDSNQINLIQRWISEGMNETYCPDDCDTVNVTYSKQIQPLISSYCKGCHTGYIAGGGVNLEIYETVSNQVKNGKVICTVTAQGCNLMPKGGPSLSPCNIRKIILWKESGCPEK